MVDTLTKLTGAVLRLGNPLGNSEKRGTVLGHISTLWVIVPAQWLERVCVEPKKALCQSKDMGSVCNRN
jgi:hypothetical protein